MTKAKRQMTEDIKLIDLVIELIDARIPAASRNPDIDSIAGSKARLILLNKKDLADEKITDEWVRYFEDKGISALAVDSLVTSDLKNIDRYVQKVCAAKIERDRKKGIKNRPVRAMVAGIPNVGKSTFINSFSRKAAAKTGNRPGVTKGKQWIRLSNTLELLDTPGILWPKFEDQRVGLKLAFIGSIRDEIINVEELSLKLIDTLQELYPGYLGRYFGIETEDNETALSILEKAAAARGCISKGGRIDHLRAANMILDNYRNGKIGRFSLERPEE